MNTMQRRLPDNKVVSNTPITDHPVISQKRLTYPQLVGLFFFPRNCLTPSRRGLNLASPKIVPPCCLVVVSRRTETALSRSEQGQSTDLHFI